jgi:arylsulfatase A
MDFLAERLGEKSWRSVDGGRSGGREKVRCGPSLKECGREEVNAKGMTCLLLVALLAPAALGVEHDRPNIVIILCDDLGWGDLQSYGHPHIRTPRLDRLAAEGLRFTSCYSAAPVCSPARVGLLTGRDPNRAGVYDWIPSVEQRPASSVASRHLVHLRREELTLPQVLRRAGYATAMAGKWHCNAIFNDPQQPQPGDAGFDHWLATQNNAAPSHENPINYVRNGQPVGRLEGYSCRLAAAEGIAWMETHVRQHPDQPFFLYLPFHEPHEPVASPPELVRKYRSVARNDQEAEYFANVEHLDHAVGEVLDALDRLERADNTLVFFTSDNGPETLHRHGGADRSYGSPGPLRGMKLWTTEAGFRVPGILRWPGKTPAGGTTDVPVSSLDLLPTLAHLAGAELPSDRTLDGMNVVELFRGNEIERSRPLFWVYYNAINEQRVALRDGPWKLLAKLDGGELSKASNLTESSIDAARQAQLTDFSLYRLTDDIGEASDLSADEPEVLQELSETMGELYRELTAGMHAWPDLPLDFTPP